jgi:hypothetical protein
MECNAENYECFKNRDNVPNLRRANSASTWFLGTYASKANLPDFKACLNCSNGMYKGAFCKKYKAIINQMEVCDDWKKSRKND